MKKREIVCKLLVIVLILSTNVFPLSITYGSTKPTEVSNPTEISDVDTVWGNIGSEFGQKWYTLNESEMQNVNFKLQKIPEGCNYDLCVYDDKYNLIGETHNANSSDENITLNLNPGTYNIKVFSVEGSSSELNYILSTSLADNPFNLINNIIAVADTKNNQVSVSGKITSGEGKEISIMITDPKGNIVNINSITSEKDGIFNYLFTTNSTLSGTYYVILNARGLREPVTTRFKYVLEKNPVNENITRKLSESDFVNKRVIKKKKLNVPGAKEVKMGKYGVPSYIKGILTNKSSDSPKEILYKYLNNNKDLFKYDETTDTSFKIISEYKDSNSISVIKTNQYFNGIRILNTTQIFDINEYGELITVRGDFIPNLAEETSLRLGFNISNDTILESVKQKQNIKEISQERSSVEKVIYISDSKPKLAYIVRIRDLEGRPLRTCPNDFIIDANTGDILSKTSNRDFYDNVQIPGTGVLGENFSLNCKGGFEGSAYTYYMEDNMRTPPAETIFQGILTKNNNDSDRTFRSTLPNFNASSYAEGASAHYFLGKVYDFYKTKFNRNSFDNQGTAVTSRIIFDGTAYAACTRGTCDIDFGNGGPGILGIPGTYKSFSGAIEMVGHEFTHAVTFSPDMLGSDACNEIEGAAVKEGIADIMGMLIENYYYGSTDWRNGKRIRTDAPDSAVRSLANPPLYSRYSLEYRDNYRDFYFGTEDSSGEHINSTIIGKAAYLLSEGGTFNGVSVSGIGKENTTQIMFGALHRLTSEPTLYSFYKACLDSAAINQVSSVINAFLAVGIENREDGYTVELFKPEYTNTVGKVTQILPNQTIYVKQRIRNTQTYNQNACSITAFYDASNSMLDVGNSDHNSIDPLRPNELDEFSKPFRTPANVTGCKIKSFVWDSFTSLIPMSDTISFP